MGPEQQSEPATNASAQTTPAQHLAETLPPPGPAGERAADDDCPPELRDHSRYRIVRLLGRGGMGAVYQALHMVMDRHVALKVMRPELTENPAAVERFRREVKAAAQLVHPNIVTAFDAEQAGGIHFLVMEYVNGRTLAELVAAEGPLPVELAGDFVTQAAQGLQHAHERGMIHRDIKPHNLMISDCGFRIADFRRDPSAGPLAGDPQSAIRPGAPGQSAIVKILDFGLARFHSDGGNASTASGVILGTVDFMAPEQADSAKNADIRSDIYALGCTLYYLLAGRVPFPDGSLIQRVMAHVEKEPPPLDKLRPGLPPGLVDVVATMLAKKPADRYQTPAEVVQALAPFRGGAAAAIPTVEAVDEPRELDTEPITLLPRPAPELEVLEVIPVGRPAPKPRRRSRAITKFLLDLVTALLVLSWVIVLIVVADSVVRGIRLRTAAYATFAAVTVVAWGALFIRLRPRRTSRRQAGAGQVRPAGPRTGLVLLGCFGLAALAIVGFIGLAGYLGWILVDRGVKFAESAVKHQQTWGDLEKSFTPPPADVAGDRVFPQRLGGYERADMDRLVAAPELNIETVGRRATYRRGNEEIFVHIFQPVTRLEKEALFRRVLDLAKNSGSGGVSSYSGGPSNDRIWVRLERGDMIGKQVRLRAHLWWNRNWLFVLRAPTNVDPEPLLTEYLNWLIQNPGAN